MNLGQLISKLLRQALPAEKPSDKWEGRIVRVDPPHIGDVTKKEYPFLAQIRLRTINRTTWTDYEYKETCEEAEESIRHFKAKTNTPCTCSWVNTIIRHVFSISNGAMTAKSSSAN